MITPSDMDVRDARTSRGRDRAGRAVAKPMLLAVAVATLVTIASAAAEQAGVGAAAAAKRRAVVYCTRHHRPPGCVVVPKSAKRPKKVGQQGGDALTPTDVENGGGLGGGPGDHRATALAWARTQLRQERWEWRCERFVEEAYGTRKQFVTAAAALSKLALHREPIAAAPPGALVYFAADRYNRGYGHVGLSTGAGRMISALTTVRITDVARSRYWRSLYVGWADAPGTWPGRIPPPPGPTTEDPELTVRITAPAFGQTVSGSVPLLASAPRAGGVAFEAYYATDPRDAATRGWHELGSATPSDASWVFEWDTTKVPDQGFGQWGTVNVAAIALDAQRNRTGTRDYRRVSVDNSGGPPPSPPPPPPPPPSAATYAETTGGATNTWTNYMNAGGIQGPTIPANTTVQIACKLTGFKVSDGNTWWYRIASSPWNGAYHSSADAFYNNGQTSGSLVGTPFVDPAVPTCP
jgi:hypothetical protein